MNLARPSSGPEVVAAFDLDGTLTRGGSTWPFLFSACGWAKTARATALELPRIIMAAVLGGHRVDDAKEALLIRTLGGTQATEIARRAEIFGPRHYQKRARAGMRDRLEQHRRQGHRLVLVSASLELYVAVIGELLAVDQVIATRLALDADGRLTGRYDGGNCRGHEKIVRVRRWMEKEAAGAQLWAYGNSSGDHDLLTGADVGVDVGRLGRLGRLRAFRRLRDTAELVSS